MVKLAIKDNNLGLKKISLQTQALQSSQRLLQNKRRCARMSWLYLVIETLIQLMDMVNSTTKYTKPQQQVKCVSRIASTKEEGYELINNYWQQIEKDGEAWYFISRKLNKSLKSVGNHENRLGNINFLH
jgi:hypothetical protein